MRQQNKKKIIVVEFLYTLKTENETCKIPPSHQRKEKIAIPPSKTTNYDVKPRYHRTQNKD